MLGKLVLLLALVSVVTKVTCMTNQEFYDLIHEYGEDVVETDITSMDTDDVDDETITLLGGPDIDIELEDLLQFFQEFAKDPPAATDDKSVTWWWHHHHHHHHRHHHRRLCHCHHHGCKCCIGHTYRINLLFKHVHVKFHPCIEVDYLPRNYGFKLHIWFNGHSLFHREISLKHPPGLCFGIPPLRRFARACIEIYNVNIARKHICVRVAGHLNLLFHKFHIHLKIACFTIPMLDEQALNKHLTDMDNWALDADDSGSHVEDWTLDSEDSGSHVEDWTLDSENSESHVEDFLRLQASE